MDFRRRYKFDSENDLIGKGGFSRVFKAYDTIRKRDVALKFYHGIASDKYDIISEINRMEDIVHPNLIRYYDADIIISTNAIGEREELQVGIMEYANAGDIGSYFKVNRGKETTKNVIHDILKGLQYLHIQAITHRDLKPKNILLHQNENGRLTAKIADFGISKRAGIDDTHVSSQLMGSVEYMTPEQFAPAIYGIDGKPDTNADLWSLGIILYEVFAGKLPFGSRTKGVTYERILNNILFTELAIDYELLPEPYRSIVRRCLVKHAGKRARQAEELIDILEGKDPAERNVVIPPKSGDDTEGVKTSILGDFNKDNTPTDQRETEAHTKILDTDKGNDGAKTEDFFDFSKKEPDSGEGRVTGGRAVANEIKIGKELFKLGNYPESFKVLDKYRKYLEFDIEAKFYLGFMYYNGKCGGAHDVTLGRRLMNEAKLENRPFVLELMLKYVLNK